jgi:hypothetical protein
MDCGTPSQAVESQGIVINRGYTTIGCSPADVTGSTAVVLS